MSEQGRLIEPRDSGPVKQERCQSCGFEGLYQGACARCGAGIRATVRPAARKRKAVQRGRR